MGSMPRKKPFVCKLDAKAKEDIDKFLNSEDASIPLPDKKHAGKRFLKSSLKQTLNMYHLLDKTRRKISLTTLRHYRSKYVKLRGQIPMRQSCCEVCTNFENILSKMSRHLKATPADIETACKWSLCETKEYFPSVKCALHECDKCGTQKVMDAIFHANAVAMKNKKIFVMVKQ